MHLRPLRSEGGYADRPQPSIGSRNRNRAKLVSEINSACRSGNWQRQCQQSQNYHSPHVIPSQDFYFPTFASGTGAQGIELLLTLVHLPFQNCNRLVVIVFQQLRSKNLGCSKSRGAICCTLATNHFPQDRPESQSRRQFRLTTKRSNLQFRIGRGYLATNEKT